MDNMQCLLAMFVLTTVVAVHTVNHNVMAAIVDRIIWLPKDIMKSDETLPLGDVVVTSESL